MSAAFRHVTVVVDGSFGAEHGVAFALELVRRDGSVTFCSVVEQRRARGRLEDEARLLCERAQDRAAEHGIRADLRVLHGRGAGAIDAFARRRVSDAIVVGTSAGGAANALAGSLTEDLLLRSDVPVIVVHEGDPLRTGPIAVAVDASPAAAAALETAIRIASARSMQLALVHVVDPGRPGGAVADAILREAGERARAGGVASTPLLRSGSIADELLQASETLECCMIVIGTHGRRSAAERALGRVAAVLVQRSRVPVVTARRGASAETRPQNWQVALRRGGAPAAFHEWRALSA